MRNKLCPLQRPETSVPHPASGNQFEEKARGAGENSRPTGEPCANYLRS